MISRREKIVITGLLTWVTIGMFTAPVFEWGQEVAARNDCHSARCLIDKWHLFECTNGNAATLRELMMQHKTAEYGRLSRDCQ